MGTSVGSASSCWVPPMYKHFGVGLIEPTWEPKAQMIEQLPVSERNATICWYGYSGGQIEARVNPTDSGYYSRTFVLRSESWILVDSHQEIVVH